MAQELTENEDDDLMEDPYCHLSAVERYQNREFKKAVM